MGIRNGEFGMLKVACQSTGRQHGEDNREFSIEQPFPVAAYRKPSKQT
jgi:hypothetical protein